MTESNSNPYDVQWSASLDKMPPGPPVLRVTGVAQMPTPGYFITLQEDENQGSDPKVFILQMFVEEPPPDLIVPQMITEETVTFEKETDTDYSGVSIMPEGFYIEVEVVS